MNIRTRLRILGLVTLAGLALLAIGTTWSLNAIQSAEDTAHRREGYVADLLDVKASALSTIMLDPSAKETREVFDAASLGVEQHGSHALSVIRRTDVRDELAGLLKRWTSYRDQSMQLIALAHTNVKAANDRIMPLYNQDFKPLAADLERFIAQRRTEAKQGAIDAKALTSRLYWMICCLLGAEVLITMGVVLSVSASLQTALRNIHRELAPLSKGDLTRRLPDKGRDELDDIAAGVNLFVVELQNNVRRTREKSAQLASNALRLSRAASEVLQSASLQSDSTASVSASVEQFSVSIDHVADNAGQAEQVALQSGELSRKGEEEVLGSVDEIQKIEQIVSAAANQMQALGLQARDISSIVNVIKEVAEQTNLLALNAAIEAARAGEQGRGFAVVADEVRKLAERTTSSAQEITDVVLSVQKSTEAASEVMQKGCDLVTASVRKIQDAGGAMQQIRDSSASVLGAIGGISTSLREQRVAGAEIAKNIDLIARMTVTGRSSASDVSSTAQQLEQLARDLEDEVRHFTA